MIAGGYPREQCGSGAGYCSGDGAEVRGDNPTDLASSRLKFSPLHEY